MSDITVQNDQRRHDRNSEWKKLSVIEFVSSVLACVVPFESHLAREARAQRRHVDALMATVESISSI